MNSITLQIYAIPIKEKMKKEWSLDKKIKFSMKYVLQHDSLYWMHGSVDNDYKFKVAISAVVLSDISEEEKEKLSFSVGILNKVNAMFEHGLFGNAQELEELENKMRQAIPLMKYWKEIENKIKKGAGE